jgi:hypothetical protein
VRTWLEGIHGRREAGVFSGWGSFGHPQSLAEAGISILSLSTFDTDYVLVRVAMLAAARAALRENFALIEWNQS